jgi:hypothetical protein
MSEDIGLDGLFISDRYGEDCGDLAVERELLGRLQKLLGEEVLFDSRRPLLGVLGHQRWRLEGQIAHTISIILIYQLANGEAIGESWSEVLRFSTIFSATSILSSPPLCQLLSHPYLVFLKSISFPIHPLRATLTTRAVLT